MPSAQDLAGLSPSQELSGRCPSLAPGHGRVAPIPDHGNRIQDLQDFVARVGEGLEAAEESATRRRFFEEMDVQVVVTVEDGKKVV